MIQTLVGTLTTSPVAVNDDEVVADLRVDDDGGPVALHVRAHGNIASMLLGYRAGRQLYVEGQSQPGGRFLALFIRPARATQLKRGAA
jgi:hypothetical protein